MKTIVSTIVQITIERKKTKASPSRTPPRCSAPSEAFVLWPSVLRATIPLWPRFVPHCGLCSINASPRCRPLRLLASLRWLHIVFIPSAAQGLLLPFAASVAFPLQRGCPQGGGLGVFTSANEAPSASSRVSSPSRPDNYLSLHRVSAPRLRRHTTPLQSVVRSPNRTSITIAERLHEKTSSLCRQSVAPSLTHKTPVSLTYAANTSSRTPYGRPLPLLLVPSVL